MKSICTFLLILALLLTACSTSTADPSAVETAPSTEAVMLSPSELFSDRDRNTDSEGSVSIVLTGSSASCEDKGVSVSGSAVTIRSGGKYHITGDLNGSIVVDAQSTDHIQLILHNANIHAENTAALYVKQADKVVVTLEGENSLRTLSDFTNTEETTVDGAVFAKDDLSFNGSGSLELSSPLHGIVCKNDLVFVGGRYTVDAQKHAVSAKDSLRIADGNFHLSAGGDGLHAENTEDAKAAFIYISNGSFTIDAVCDAISAGSVLEIQDGDFGITAGGGSVNGAAHYESFGRFQNTQSSETEISTKGLKAQGNVLLHGGSFVIDAADDCIHSNSNVHILGGSYELQSGDDGIHAEEKLLIQEGAVNITKSYEGLEGHCIDINGGSIRLKASDDGLNAAGGNDGSGLGGFGRNDMFANDENAYISIAGGSLVIDAGGDGIDSNGALLVSGGETFVSGPTNSGNGALDFAGEAKVTGGLFLATGAAGMATGFGTGSTQGSIFVSYNTQSAGSKVTLTNGAGELLIDWETTKESSSIVLSCPGILQGETYHLTVGSIEGDITMTDIIYGYSSGMPGGGGGHGGRPGGR